MKKIKIKRKISLFSLIIVIILTLFEMYGNEINNALTSVLKTGDQKVYIRDDTFSVSTDLQIAFLDVGQADAILIQNEDENMLIDAGNNEDGQKLVEYFKKKGIKEFKYVVGTHPHEDHIGGLDDIINNFDIGTIYLPDVVTTTKTFEDVLVAIEKKKMTFEVPEIGSTFNLKEANFDVIYTGKDTTDLNDSSIVLKMTFGNKSFLFMGDASKRVEEKILDEDIKADVLKVGHHGSRYSSSSIFLDRVNCRDAIISCGKNNSYSHPHEETIDELTKRHINIYRTDELGTIIVTTDGKDLNIKHVKTDTNG